MKELVFATNNPHKLQEISQLLKNDYRVCGLKEIGITEEIPEDHFTLEENAFQKAEYIWAKIKSDCFADDTGLEIDALHGEPGVFSARYSRMGDLVYPEMDIAEGNIRKVLEKMQDKSNRKARFRTVIALILKGKKYSFEGRAEGRIIEKAAGSEGFGYDPIFVPDGYQETYAEMKLELKNEISHRARAVKKLVDFLSLAGN
jgi:XTP/dITP diphosphohydrolase